MRPMCNVFLRTHPDLLGIMVKCLASWIICLQLVLARICTDELKQWYGAEPAGVLGRLEACKAFLQVCYGSAEPCIASACLATFWPGMWLATAGSGYGGQTLGHRLAPPEGDHVHVKTSDNEVGLKHIPAPAYLLVCLCLSTAAVAYEILMYILLKQGLLWVSL